MKHTRRMDSKYLKFCLLYVVFAIKVNGLSVYQDRKIEERKKLATPKVTCSSQRIKAVFSSHVRKTVNVRDPTGAIIPMLENEESCGVQLKTNKNHSLVFLSKYDSCFTVFKERTVVIPLHVQLKGNDQWYIVNVSCPLKRTVKTPISQSHPPAECKIPKNLRVNCGLKQANSSELCLKLGCCYEDYNEACFYKLNSCSLDGHFVFSVTESDTNFPINPNHLTVKGQSHCLPVITTSDTAVFKVGLTECGVQKKEINKTMFYEVEVEDDTDASFSLQVTCEYEPSEIKKAAHLSALFKVTNPPPAVAFGNVEVQMRIAKDSSFTAFFAEHELPVTLPLQKAAHVELSIVEPSPDPTLSLRVRDCFAYPATKHSVWNLLHDGCPNLLDDMHSSIPVDKEGKIDSHSRIRRFDVRTFAFLDPDTGYHSTEPVYFYCWVEICAKNMVCVQDCSITSSGDKRKRREALYTSDHFHLISLGPLLEVEGQNNTDVEDDPCQKSKKMFQVTVYALSAIIAALLLVALCIAIKSIRRCRRMLSHTTDAQENPEECQ